MAAIATIVFIALYFVEAGYGMLFDKKMGISDTEQDRLGLYGSSGFYRNVFVMERIGTTV